MRVLTTRAWALIRATHAPPTLAVTAFVAAVAASAGLSAGRTATLAAAILVGQASIGWANDAWDAERDTISGRPDKPVATGEISARLVFGCAAVALLADVPLSLAVGWRPGAAHLVAVGSAWLYDLRLKETPASPAPYALSFGLLPVIIASALPGHPLPRPSIVAAAGCLGVAAHFANTVGDTAEDAATGVRGLPQLIGPQRSIVAAALLVAVAAWLLAAGTGFAIPSLVGAALSVAAVPVSIRPPRFAGRHAAFASLIAAVAALIIAFVISGGQHLTAP